MHSFVHLVALFGCISISLPLVLSFNYPPKFIKGPNVQDILPGESIQFECRAISDDGLPISVSWQFNKKEVKENAHFKLQNHSQILQIKVSETTEGEYCCIAKINEKLYNHRCGILHVKKAPHAIISPTIIFTDILSSFTLQCTVTGRPLPSISWYFNNTPILCFKKRLSIVSDDNLCSHLIQGDNSLSILNMSYTNVGRYQCSAWNPLGKGVSKFATVMLKNHTPEMRSPKTSEPLHEELSTNASVFESDDVTYAVVWLVIVLLLGVIGSTVVFLLVVRRHKWLNSNGNSSTMRPSNLVQVNYDATCSSRCSSTDQFNHLQCPDTQFKIVKEIGRGVFGKVYQAVATSVHENTEDFFVAIKFLSNDNLNSRSSTYREASILRSFAHPNIVHFLGISQVLTNLGEHSDYQERIPPFLVFEYVDGGDLCAHLRNMLQNATSTCPVNRLAGDINFDDNGIDKLKVCWQISLGMQYLSNHNFVHRDLATRNCLISVKGVVKIADFGLSRKMVNSDYYKSGDAESAPIRWMAPESLLHGRYSAFSDVWAFGVVMWEVYTYAMQPYFGLTNQQAIQAILKGNVLPKPSGAPTWVYNLMRVCWSYSVSDRPDFSATTALLDDYRNLKAKSLV